jgi:hypothetical protein
MRHTSEYNIWCGIKSRCYNINDKKYSSYGGRGICVCEEWLNNFQCFYNDIGPRPSKKHSIDRIDNDGNYCKSNCRWATRFEQDNNKRTSVYIEYNGEKLTYTEWSIKTKIPMYLIRYRIRHGWSIEDALTVQPSKHNNRYNKNVKNSR